MNTKYSYRVLSMYTMRLPNLQIALLPQKADELIAFYRVVFLL